MPSFVPQIPSITPSPFFSHLYFQMISFLYAIIWSKIFFLKLFRGGSPLLTNRQFILKNFLRTQFQNPFFCTLKILIKLPFTTLSLDRWSAQVGLRIIDSQVLLANFLSQADKSVVWPFMIWFFLSHVDKSIVQSHYLHSSDNKSWTASYRVWGFGLRLAWIMTAFADYPGI